MREVLWCPYSPICWPQRASNEGQCSLTAFGLQTPPWIWRENYMRYVCIKYDVLSGKPCSFTKAHPSIAYKSHQPARPIISCVLEQSNESLTCPFSGAVTACVHNEGVDTFIFLRWMTKMTKNLKSRPWKWLARVYGNLVIVSFLQWKVDKCSALSRWPS